MELHKTEDISQQIENTFQGISELDETAKKEKITDIKHMITVYNTMTNKMEDRRQGIFNVSLQYVAFLIAAIALLQNSQLPDSIKIGIQVFIFTQVIISFFVVVKFILQSNHKFPFLDLEYSNRWKWFYYGNPDLSNMSSDLILSSEKKQVNKISYLKGLLFYSNRYLKETIDQELEDNLIQLYLLQVHNLYKNKYYLQLTSLREKGIIFSLITSILVALILFLK